MSRKPGVEPRHRWIPREVMHAGVGRSFGDHAGAEVWQVHEPDRLIHRQLPGQHRLGQGVMEVDEVVGQGKAAHGYVELTEPAAIRCRTARAGEINRRWQGRQHSGHRLEQPAQPRLMPGAARAQPGEVAARGDDPGQVLVGQVGRIAEQETGPCPAPDPGVGVGGRQPGREGPRAMHQVRQVQRAHHDEHGHIRGVRAPAAGHPGGPLGEQLGKLGLAGGLDRAHGLAHRSTAMPRAASTSDSTASGSPEPSMNVSGTSPTSSMTASRKSDCSLAKPARSAVLP